MKQTAVIKVRFRRRFEIFDAFVKNNKMAMEKLYQYISKGKKMNIKQPILVLGVISVVCLIIMFKAGLMTKSIKPSNAENSDKTIQNESVFSSAAFKQKIKGRTVSFTDTSSGNVKNHKWDFGDHHEATGKNPEHTFRQEGTYNVSLTIVREDGSQDSSSTIIEISDSSDSLVASFTHVVNGMSVKFTGENTGEVDSYFWDFGDHEISTDPNPLHVYSNNGTYNASLIVADKNGNRDSISMKIVVGT